jgi:hypothetical protein
LARGELDQALELNEQRRPIAEMLRDIDSLAHIHFLNAQIRLERGDHERGALQTIYEDLALPMRSTSSWIALTALRGGFAAGASDGDGRTRG